MQGVRAVRRMLVTLLAFLALGAIVSACRDTTGNGTGIELSGGPRFYEGYELDTLKATVCGGETVGEYPDCRPAQCDPNTDAWCGPMDYCQQNPNDPSCKMDPCEMYPESCYGGEDPGTSEPETPYQPAPEPKPGEPDACPNCREKPLSIKQQESIKKQMDLIQCESMRDHLDERLRSGNVLQFGQQPAGMEDPNSDKKMMGKHVDGTIYIWDGMWKKDSAGNYILNSQGELIPRDVHQFVKDVLVHEIAHYYWSEVIGYEGHTLGHPSYDPANRGMGTHHTKWRETMAECGYPGTTG